MAPNRGRSLALLALAAAVLPVTSTLIGAEALRELEADFGKAELQLWAQGSSTQSTTAPVGTSTQTTTASGSRGGRAKVMDFRNDSSSGQQENLTLADRVRPTLRPAAGDGPRGVAKTGPPSSQATWTTTPPAAEAAANAGRQNSSAPQAAAHAGPKVIDFRNGNEDDSQLAAGIEPEADKNGTFNATNATAEADNTTNATAEADNSTNATAEADKNGTFNATNATAEADNTTNATAEAAKEVFNCSAGALRWQWGWSDEKKAHCCQHEQVGCTANATMSATASGPTTAAGSEEAGLVAMAPSSETIRKMICVAAGSPELEDEMVNLVCDEIEAAMPWAKDQFEPDCGTALKAAWADILADCPRDTQAPSSEDITRIMCNFALGDGLRGQALRDMCKVVEREFPWMKLEPNCHTVLEGMADRAAQGCNGTRATGTTGTWSSTTSSSATVSTTTATTDTSTSTSATSTISTTPTIVPLTHTDIERLVCTSATRSQISGRHYGDVCSRISREHPQAARSFRGDCLAVLNADWDSFVENCPDGSETVARSSYEREHLICTFSTRDQIEGRKAGQVCEQIDAKLPWVGFGGACRDKLAEVWEDAAEKCPHGHEVTPSAEDLQKLACTFGTQRQIKAGAIGDVCKRIGTKLPWLKFATNCLREMKSVWPNVEQTCPLGAETKPAPEDYTKLVCGLATPQQIRVGDSSGVCNVIHSELPWLEFEPDCETVLNDGTVWYDARMRCPKGRQTVPSPYEIVKLVCTVSSAAQVAAKSTRDVCDAMGARVPWVVEVFDPDCPTVLEAAWDEVVTKCPQGRETVPSLEEFSRLACGMATRAEMEARDSKTLCGKMAYHVPWMVMQPSCKSWFDSSWEQLSNACPYGHDVLLSSESLVKVICSVASRRQIQNTEGQATCAQIESKTPWFNFVPDCPTALAGVWEEAAAQCPEGSGGSRGMPVSV